MVSVQLEFNLGLQQIDNTHFNELKCHVEAIDESLGKIRRKLFAEVGQLKKICEELRKENQELKNLIQTKNTPIQWDYTQEETLFKIV